MVKLGRKFYSKEFKERVLSAYYSSEESVSEIAVRFQVNSDTVGSWIYRSRQASDSKKSVKLSSSGTDYMKKDEMLPEAIEARIRDLEGCLAREKMRSACLEKMIEIAERELKIDIRKKSGAKQSMR